MRKHSEIQPQTLQPAQGGVVEFNYNVQQVSDGYDYDSVDVIGEVVRVNVKYAMMLESYSSEEINEMENVKRYSQDPTDQDEYAVYKAVKEGCDIIITGELGPDFK